jgi:hypothetical protein
MTDAAHVSQWCLRYSYRGVPDSKAHVVQQPVMQAELPPPHHSSLSQLESGGAMDALLCVVCCLLVSCQTREDRMVRDIQHASVGRSGRVQVGQLQTLARYERENSEEAAILTEPHIVADKTYLKALLQPATHVPTSETSDCLSFLYHPSPSLASKRLRQASPILI